MLQPRPSDFMPPGGTTSRAAITRAALLPGLRPAVTRAVTRVPASVPSADAVHPPCPPRGPLATARFCARVAAEALAGAVLLTGMGLLPLALGRLLGIA